MGFGKRKRQAEPRSRDDPKKPRTAGEGPGQGDGHDCLEGEGNEAEPRKDNGVWSTGNMCNPKFDAFYRAQGFLVGEDDWTNFISALKSPLPASFRLNPNYQFKDRLRQELFDFSQSIAAVASADGDATRPAVEPLLWFEGGSAYRLGADRRAIRRIERLEDLHKWMIEHTENGNITRQEAVSMVPPLALDVHPHHRCLDMCAAPGSKTTQILEIIARGGEEGEAGQGRGMVVANDADSNRAYMLVHQCRRMTSSALVITTHKGQEFPSIRPMGPDGAVLRKGCFFDRVLCDVPCSGDGTLRKSPHIWAKWSAGSGVDLHQLQLIIARRGLELLKPGGLMVYSTCSMSPYEDEAVIAELLRSHADLELIDGRQFLPRFRCRPGMSSWHVLDDARVPWKAGDGPVVLGSAMAVDGTEGADAAPTDTVAPMEGVPDAVKACLDIGFRYFRTPADVPDRGSMKKRYRASLFPPTVEEAASMHLDRCMRCVPQDEDTGGFFVATLRRKEQPATVLDIVIEAMEAETVAQSAAAPESVGVSIGYTKKKKYQRGSNEYQMWDPEQFERVKAFYGFTGLSAEAFYIRDDFSNQKGNGSNSKSVYYFPPVLREFMAGDADERVKCVSAGVKVLERKDKTSRGEIEYRLVQDGVEIIARHMDGSPRVVDINVQEFCNLLSGGLVSFNTLTQTTVEALSRLGPGSLVCTYSFDPRDCTEAVEEDASANSSGEIGARYVFRIVCFRGPSRTINVMCSKLDMDSIRRQLEALGVYRPKISATKPKSALEEVEAEVGTEAIVVDEKEDLPQGDVA